MPSRTSLRIMVALVFLALATGAYANKDELPEVTEDGLHRVHGSKLAIVYAEPGASLADYNRVLLLEPYIAFRKNWERDQRAQSVNRISPKDVEKIKNALSEEFDKVFRTTLTEGGYPVVDEAGDDVLLIRPAIINLDVNAPDTPSAGRSRTYASSAGEMTLYVEVYDSTTGDLMAKALDRQTDNANNAFYTWSNSVTNKAAADRILKGWAKILLNALNEAKTRPGQEAASE